jgi:hypothetical protein
MAKSDFSKPGKVSLLDADIRRIILGLEQNGREEEMRLGLGGASSSGDNIKSLQKKNAAKVFESLDASKLGLEPEDLESFLLDVPVDSSHSKALVRMGRGKECWTTEAKNQKITKGKGYDAKGWITSLKLEPWDRDPSQKVEGPLIDANEHDSVTSDSTSFYPESGGSPPWKNKLQSRVSSKRACVIFTIGFLTGLTAAGLLLTMLAAMPSSLESELEEISCLPCPSSLVGPYVGVNRLV